MCIGTQGMDDYLIKPWPPEKPLNLIYILTRWLRDKQAPGPWAWYWGVEPYTNGNRFRGEQDSGSIICNPKAAHGTFACFKIFSAYVVRGDGDMVMDNQEAFPAADPEFFDKLWASLCDARSHYESKWGPIFNPIDH